VEQKRGKGSRELEWAAGRKHKQRKSRELKVKLKENRGARLVSEWWVTGTLSLLGQ
jgi:hypothetical protein